MSEPSLTRCSLCFLSNYRPLVGEVFREKTDESNFGKPMNLLRTLHFSTFPAKQIVHPLFCHFPRIIELIHVSQIWTESMRGCGWVTMHGSYSGQQQLKESAHPPPRLQRQQLLYALLHPGATFFRKNLRSTAVIELRRKTFSRLAARKCETNYGRLNKFESQTCCQKKN